MNVAATKLLACVAGACKIYMAREKKERGRETRDVSLAHVSRVSCACYAGYKAAHSFLSKSVQIMRTRLKNIPTSNSFKIKNIQLQLNTRKVFKNQIFSHDVQSRQGTRCPIEPSMQTVETRLYLKKKKKKKRT